MEPSERFKSFSMQHFEAVDSTDLSALVHLGTLTADDAPRVVATALTNPEQTLIIIMTSIPVDAPGYEGQVHRFCIDAPTKEQALYNLDRLLDVLTDTLRRHGADVEFTWTEVDDINKQTSLNDDLTALDF